MELSWIHGVFTDLRKFHIKLKELSQVYRQFWSYGQDIDIFFSSFIRFARKGCHY